MKAIHEVQHTQRHNYNNIQTKNSENTKSNIMLYELLNVHTAYVAQYRFV